MVAWIKNDWVDQWSWEGVEPDENMARPMANSLALPGLLGGISHASPPMDRDSSQFLAWDLMLAHPNWVVTNKDCKVLVQQCHPSDGLDFMLHAKGLWTCVGDEAHPLVVLLDQHVQAMDTKLDVVHCQAKTPAEQRLQALAGLGLLSS